MSYKYKPTLCFCPAQLDACGMWRFFWPHLRIPESRFLFTGGCPDVNEICESDIVCLQRLLTQANIKFMQTVRALGVRIIYDLDDNIWQIPDTNYAKWAFGSPEVQTGMAACAEWADVLTVSTKTLKKVVENRWGFLRNAATQKEIPVMVYSNRVYPEFFQPKPKEDDGIITIGWAGSTTHAGDLFQIWPTLLRLLDTYDNVRVELVGQHAPFQHPHLSYKQWAHISEYTFVFSNWNWDIILAPLDDHKFNLSKSDIKMQEAGACGKPCLASFIRPYQDFCKEDKELQWQLCSIPMQWERKLTKLIEDTAFRKALGEKMYTHTMQYYHIDNTIGEWDSIAEVAYAAHN